MQGWKWRHSCALALWTASALGYGQTIQIGREVAIPEHLQNGQEVLISLTTLLNFGKDLFTANWTVQEGQGDLLRKALGLRRGFPIQRRRCFFLAISTAFRLQTLTLARAVTMFRSPVAQVTLSPTSSCSGSGSTR
jgi:hypothetical protein